MGATTGIAWTDSTWNPLRGCSRVSEGCRNCYAETVAARFSGPGQPYDGLATRSPGRWTGKVALVEEHLSDPLRWTKPRRIFVNSMSDLFHENVPDEWIDRVFAVMALSPQHTFQVLTKRPERMRDYIAALDKDGTERIVAAAEKAFDDEAGVLVANWINGFSRPRNLPDDGNPLNGTVRRWPLPNVWMGTSVEDQATADARIPLLLQTPAAVRFVSYEPALGPVMFDTFLGKLPEDEDGAPYPGTLDWIIVGGESGSGARPFGVAWARSTVAQCKAAGVGCFVKQLGARPFIRLGATTTWPRPDSQQYEEAVVSDHDGYIRRLADRKGGDPSEWPKDLRVQEFPR